MRSWSRLRRTTPTTSCCSRTFCTRRAISCMPQNATSMPWPHTSGLRCSRMRSPCVRRCCACRSRRDRCSSISPNCTRSTDSRAKPRSTSRSMVRRWCARTILVKPRPRSARRSITGRRILDCSSSWPRCCRSRITTSRPPRRCVRPPVSGARVARRSTRCGARTERASSTRQARPRLRRTSMTPTGRPAGSRCARSTRLPRPTTRPPLRAPDPRRLQAVR